MKADPIQSLRAILPITFNSENYPMSNIDIGLAFLEALTLYIYMSVLKGWLGWIKI